jgi:hypothetical protein
MNANTQASLLLCRSSQFIATNTQQRAQAPPGASYESHSKKSNKFIIFYIYPNQFLQKDNNNKQAANTSFILILFNEHEYTGISFAP